MHHIPTYWDILLISDLCPKNIRIDGRMFHLPHLCSTTSSPILSLSSSPVQNLLYLPAMFASPRTHLSPHYNRLLSVNNFAASKRSPAVKFRPFCRFSVFFPHRSAKRSSACKIFTGGPRIQACGVFFNRTRVPKDRDLY